MISSPTVVARCQASGALGSQSSRDRPSVGCRAVHRRLRLRGAVTPQACTDLVCRIVAALADPDAMAEACINASPTKSGASRKARAANRPGVARLARRATPLSDGALIPTCPTSPHWLLSCVLHWRVPTTRMCCE